MKTTVAGRSGRSANRERGQGDEGTVAAVPAPGGVDVRSEDGRTEAGDEERARREQAPVQVGQATAIEMSAVVERRGGGRDDGEVGGGGDVVKRPGSYPAQDHLAAGLSHAILARRRPARGGDLPARAIRP
jgi:hypothetical protein